jgi:zinc/manganese transport system substrate-binding protein
VHICLRFSSLVCTKLKNPHKRSAVVHSSVSSRLKGRRLYAILTAALLLAAAAAAYWMTLKGSEHERSGGLKVAVTFPSLKPDVELLACEGDTVVSIAPPGVDPHEYQLAPSDVEVLRSSDLIISTGHAPFEARIADLVAKGEVKAELVEVPSVPGIKLLTNPATGQENLHWPIYDPANYLAFVKRTADAMAGLRPSCAQAYRERAAAIERELDSLLSRAPKINATAVGYSPEVQYAVEWAGVKVSYLLVKEHDLPATPEDIAAADRALAEGRALLVVSVKGAESMPLGAKAEELARKYGRPIVYVPSPLEVSSTLEKLNATIAELSRAAQQLRG